LLPIFLDYYMSSRFVTNIFKLLSAPLEFVTIISVTTPSYYSHSPLVKTLKHYPSH